MADGILKAGPSLADTAYCHCVDLWVAFMEIDPSTREGMRSPFWRLLKPGFRHVECWKFMPPGAWIRLNTGIELISAEVYLDPPWTLMARLNPTVVKVQRFIPHGYWREPFFIGPVTCVEQVKAFLGIRNAFIRTPYQLYKDLTKREKRRIRGSVQSGDSVHQGQKGTRGGFGQIGAVVRQRS